MPEAVIVRKVEDKHDFREFFSFPWTLYKDDPNWTPNLLSLRRETLDKEKNPAWDYLEGDYFVAWRGDTAVGTIAAFVNHRHNEFHNEHIAWFGFFETINDTDVANALLDTATNWARERGYAAIRGPQSFTTHEECGLLVDGFEHPPVMLMPYNYDYYPELVETAGFHKVMDVKSMHLFYDKTILGGSDTLKRIERIVDRIRKRSNVRIRPIDRKNQRRDFEVFKQIYNDAWDLNWGFTPMTDRELDALIDGLSQLFDPQLACFAEVDGEPVGFLLGVPDFNQVLRRAYPRPGVPEFITLIRALWHWKIRPKITWMRIPLMGVKSDYRKMGLDLLMYYHMRDVMLSRGVPYQHIDAGWVLETNNDLIGVLEKIGMEAYKTHRFYEKSL